MSSAQNVANSLIEMFTADKNGNRWRRVVWLLLGFRIVPETLFGLETL